MKLLTLALGGLAVGAGAATAGDIERSQQSVAILFEQGRYAEFSFGYVKPDVSGRVGPGIPGSGNMAGSFNTWSFGYKQPLGSNMDFALILDQPIGADIDYPGNTGYPLDGTTAELRSSAITALLRYKLENNFSLYGGLRAQSVEGQAHILSTFPSPIDGSLITTDYNLDTNKDYSFGYVVGVAWEKPEIAARVALTYNSAIDHTLEADETATNPVFGDAAGESEFDTTVPQSVNLELQTGVAPDTLLFGSIRWVEWSEFLIDPAIYQRYFPGLPLVAYDSDRFTYTIGLGRKFTENWSGAMTIAYEPQTNDITGNLGPNDGYASIGLGATYTHDNMKITGGVRYIKLGDAITRGLSARFEDNDAIAVGMRVGFTF
ncbi:OmpP1/FadL family transporter [Rhodobacter sp. CZR27]|uniref:OmpP1/FadL family transporter n=1 Tax=Rhodobacter sp. CZR27 TaxID=2033869 RepID=UPI0018E06B59|nr:outer membrane protein transport protein [Rhodobacter sp. CZR27]